MSWDLNVDGRIVDVRVRRSKRARRASVCVAPGEPVEVVLPQRMAERHVAEILAEKQQWIRRQLRRVSAFEAREDELGLDRPGVVWVHGHPVTVDDQLTPSERSSEESVLRWYRREARRRIARLLEREARLLEVAPGRLSIRDPKTRWGSCSSGGGLSFSWRLLLAPLAVLDYVVVHELCHLRELNHSPAFWRHLERARPAHRVQSDWLGRYGHELHRYRPVLGPPVGTQLTLELDRPALTSLPDRRPA